MARKPKITTDAEDGIVVDVNEAAPVEAPVAPALPIINTPDTVQVAEKRPITILDKDGKFNPPPLTKLNQMSHGSIVGRKAREKSLMQQVGSVIKQAMRRA